MMQRHLAYGERTAGDSDARITVASYQRIILVPTELRLREAARRLAMQFRSAAQLQAQRGGRLTKGLANVCKGKSWVSIRVRYVVCILLQLQEVVRKKLVMGVYTAKDCNTRRQPHA